MLPEGVRLRELRLYFFQFCNEEYVHEYELSLSVGHWFSILLWGFTGLKSTKRTDSSNSSSIIFQPIGLYCTCNKHSQKCKRILENFPAGVCRLLYDSVGKMASSATTIVISTLRSALLASGYKFFRF